VKTNEGWGVTDRGRREEESLIKKDFSDEARGTGAGLLRGKERAQCD